MKLQQRSLHLAKRSLLQNLLVMLFLLWMLPACSANTPATHSAPAIPTPACSVYTPVSAPSITAKELQTMLPLPGFPFASAATHDGRWIFVSLDVANSGKSSGIAVLQSDGGNIKIAHFIALPDSHTPLGLTLTHDERQLVVADSLGVSVLDTAKMEAGSANALLGSIADGPVRTITTIIGRKVTLGVGTIEVTLSRDERYLFATDEYAKSVSVMNFARLRAGDFSADAYAGRVPVDPGPVGMALSPDGRSLYVTSEGSAQVAPCGTLSVVDVERAESTPAHAVVGHVFAGANPVRVVVSAQGDLVWVTARGSNALLAFKTSLLLKDPAHALVAAVPVGPAPVGLILIRQDTQMVVANSNRFVGGNSSQTAMIVDVKRALSSSSAVLGSITVGSFPREMFLDGSTLLLTNYDSKTLSLIDLNRLP